jgi:hypothetical protein
MPWRIGARNVVGMLNHLPITTTIRSLMLAGVASAALAAPSSALVPQDVGFASTPAGHARIDLRSPDAQDAGQPVAFDLRSPDAAQPVVAPATRPVIAPHATPRSVTGEGFDVLSALIGAAAAALLAMGAVVLVRTRGHHGVATLGS